MALLCYVSHPEVRIDPAVPVPDWSLSERGRVRVAAMLAQPWVAEIGRIVSSAETKAAETATILADHLGLTVEVRPETAEIDRSATGYVPHDRHEELADRLFDQPAVSADGWETAHAAQARVVDALADLLIERAVGAGDVDCVVGADGAGDVAVVGHGGVGTLLMCHLAGLPIDRANDQPGGGHHWAFDRTTRKMLHRWEPIDGPASSSR